MSKADELLLENQELEVKERKAQMVYSEKMLAVSLHGDKMEQARRGVEICLQILRIENHILADRTKHIPDELRNLAITKAKEFLNELKPFKDLTA
jgi:hypothetical protein